MPKLPVITPRRLVAALLRQGFFVDRQRGSHLVLRHRDGRTTVIPMHARDLARGTLHSILGDIDMDIGALTKIL